MENTTSLRTFSWNKKKGKPLPPITEANLFFTRAKNREGTQVGRETKQSTRDFQFYVRVFILHGWNAVAEHTERCYRAATFQPSPAFSSSLCDKNFFHGLFAEERCDRLSLSSQPPPRRFPGVTAWSTYPRSGLRQVGGRPPEGAPPLLEFCEKI